MPVLVDTITDGVSGGSICLPMALSSFWLISKSDKKLGEREREGWWPVEEGYKKKTPSVVVLMSFKNVQWCDSNCSRPFSSIAGFNNTDTISSTSWYDRRLTMEIFHVWYKCPPWMYLRFAVTLTANIISWRLSWHYFDASCFCRHGVSASMWKNLNSEQIKKAWRHSQAVPDSSTRRPSRWHSLWFPLSFSRVQRTFW